VSKFRLPLREDLIGQDPYGAPQDKVVARLNVNENPFAPSQELRQALAAAVMESSAEINRYPDRDAEQLRGALSNYIVREAGITVAWEQIWVANGSNEVMSHVMSAFGGPGRVALTFAPTYSMYPDYARDSFTNLITIERTADFTIDVGGACEAIVANRPSLVLVASPNNPTGTETPLDALRALAECAEHNNALLVVDEAYAEFRRDKESTAIRLLHQFPNIIVTRTMSKAFGFAGARVGYCLASSPAIINALMLVRLPYHLSAITQAVAIAALSMTGELANQVEILRSERDALVQDLLDLNIQVVPSDANFILFGQFPSRHDVWQALLDRGVLIRETGPEGWLRVSIGTPKENKLIIESMRNIMNLNPIL